MDPPRHLQIINPSRSGGDHVLFAPFTRLSIELRLRIWQLAVQQHRLLEIEVKSNSSDHDQRSYVASVQGYQLHSKLLFINRESREVALKFYRVHIPCYIKRNKDDATENHGPSTLYFNPEWDFIHLRGLQGPGHPFVDFFHDLKARDPRGVGLLSLGLDHNSMMHVHSLTDIPEAASKASFVATLSQLQNLVWIAQSHAPRGIMGLLHGFRGIGVQFSHSMPIKSSRQTFELFNRDPRPVGPELKSVLTASSDPRIMRVHWRQVLKKWEIVQKQPIKERVLFAYEPPSYDQQICDISKANEFLKVEEEKWLAFQGQRMGLVKRFAGKAPLESPEELANAVRPAIGFWLFPAEALGSLDENFKSMKCSFDMTGHWPELALSSIA